MQHRVPILLAGLILGWIATGCASANGPENTVRRFDGLVREGKWDEALALVDLGAKAARMLGDLYTAAPEADRKVTCDIWGRRLKLATETYYKNHFKDGPGELSVTSLGDGKAEVVQKEGTFVLVYELELRDGNWIIVDRAHEKDGVRPSVEKGMAVVLKRIQGEIGHPPTLADVNQRLEFYLDRTRERVLKIGGSGLGVGDSGKARGNVKESERRGDSRTDTGEGNEAVRLPPPGREGSN